MSVIRIGSRGSDLALWQANHVKKQLSELGHEVVIKIIRTQGDQIQHLSFDKMEGKGFFTKEIEAELLAGEIDLAVHSHKDLETNPPEGLIIGAVSDREDPSDLLLIRKEAVDERHQYRLKAGAIVGTSSARRKTQLQRIFENLEVRDLRGNVPTRVEKLRSGNYDAIVLASAGVKRLQLDLSEFECLSFDPKDFVPCPAQGVLGLQIRADDQAMAKILSALNNEEVAKVIGVERKLLNLMAGGCQLPLGSFCQEDQLHVSYAPSASETAKKFIFKIPESEQDFQNILKELKHAF